MFTVVMLASGWPRFRPSDTAFKKHFGENHRGAQIEIHAAFHIGHHRRQAAKIQQRACADRRPIGRRMHMDDIRPDGDVHGDGKT